jgi:hypothetical protein
MDMMPRPTVVGHAGLGPVTVVSRATPIYHDGTGYAFFGPVNMVVKNVTASGSWADIATGQDTSHLTVTEQHLSACPDDRSDVWRPREEKV